ncbi:hypothetical protein TSUD_28650 [Trifolium subterraneum]|uniref:Uncharacterized protein n=1 Tax=Trifolium subterraneum TaxID=3900 RepID=A0A2Z6NPE6_TRISU|nr:hypothetical protein TSUD_28650 [Trifolium subterraneum]
MSTSQLGLASIPLSSVHLQERGPKNQLRIRISHARISTNNFIRNRKKDRNGQMKIYELVQIESTCLKI